MNLKLISVAAALAISAAVAQEVQESVAPAQEPEVTTDEASVKTTETSETSADTASVAKANETIEASSETNPVQNSTDEANPVAENTAVALIAEVPAAADTSAPSVDSVKDTVKANFDVLRTRAYNTVGNQAAASTVADILAKPHEMHGNKFVYAEPSLEYAAIAFGENNTYFLSFRNTTGSQGFVTAGFATAAFGVEVYGAVGKTWTLRDEPNRDDNLTSVDAGDEIGAIYSMPIGPIDLTVSASWLTTAKEESGITDIKSTKTHVELERDYWDVNAKVAVSNTPSKNKLISWSTGIGFLRHNLTEINVDGKDETLAATLDSRVEITPFFNAGMQVLKTNNARVLIGLNTNVPVSVYDDIENKNTYVRRDHVALSVETTPNILAELALNDNWMLFSVGGYKWNIFSTESLNEGDTDIDVYAMKSNRVYVDAGVRFQYKNFAAEVALNNVFFNNPMAGFNGTTFLANFGGFIYF